MANRAYTGNFVKIILKDILEIFREHLTRRAVRGADGVQCNGTPTYNSYKHLNKNAILYFDTRVSENQIASFVDLEKRFAARKRENRLNLAFSGRLIAMKGGDHLIDIAELLRGLGRDFHMTICGGGVLEPAMRREVERRSLKGHVDFAGNLDFSTELMPFIREKVDIFVCCHRQGDPSCTYLETMACGVPIAGYANEAFAGLSKISGAGWVTPMDRPDLLARRIAELSDDEIEAHSRRCLAFATEHSFEREFARRMSHARKVAGFSE